VRRLRRPAPRPALETARRLAGGQPQGDHEHEHRHCELACIAAANGGGEGSQSLVRLANSRFRHSAAARICWPGAASNAAIRSDWLEPRCVMVLREDSWRPPCSVLVSPGRRSVRGVLPSRWSH